MYQPLVTIVLPTYNRATFLSQAVKSIREQAWRHWELLVVDDGSTDDTSAVVAELASTLTNPIKYIWRPNGGPAAARNTGIDQTTGKYLAFFDSDDLWLPHHLQDCVAALEANPDVAWVYGAGQRVALETGAILVPHSFYPSGRPRPFLELRTRQSGSLRIIEDPEAGLCQIEHGLYCGLQGSVFQRSMFEELRIPPYRIAEDQVLVLIALQRGFRIGYLDNVHVVYREHQSNTSACAAGATLQQKTRVTQEVIRCFEDAEQYVTLTSRERDALRASLSREYFWHLGYSLLWTSGRRREALQMLGRGLWLKPSDWRYWKTFCACLARTITGT